MIEVRIERRCHCVIKNDIEMIHQCQDLDTAKVYAYETLERLKNNNCKAHTFFIKEHGDVLIIDSTFNTDDIKL